MTRSLWTIVISVLLGLTLLSSWWIYRNTELAETRASDTSTTLVELPTEQTHGALLYQQHCAECHGSLGAGYANGSRAPALNGSEHAWHHSDEQIIGLLRYANACYCSNMVSRRY